MDNVDIDKLQENIVPMEDLKELQGKPPHDIYRLAGDA